MNNVYIIVSDCHGCFKTLMALIEKAKNKYPLGEVILLGDLIDRGPRSKEVVEWAIDNNIKTIVGNHEHLMIDYVLKQKNMFNDPNSQESEYIADCWLMNGGLQTIKSFNYISKRVIEWMAALPYYIIPEGYPDLLLSHTGHGLNPNRFDAVWCREWSFPKDNYYRVFGHTPNAEVEFGDNYADIDTGCAYGDIYGNKLTALIWPSKEVIEQEFIDFT